MKRPRAYGKPAPPSDKPLNHRQRAKELGLTEKHVQETVTQFLELDGWRAIRTEHAIERNERGGFKRRVGEVGMADTLFIRYGVVYTAPNLGIKVDGAALWVERRDQVMFIEFKAPGKFMEAHQRRWADAERARGALVLVVDDIDNFMKRWYPESGLQRRPS